MKITNEDKKHMLIGVAIMAAFVIAGYGLAIVAPSTAAPIFGSVDEFIEQVRAFREN